MEEGVGEGRASKVELKQRERERELPANCFWLFEEVGQVGGWPLDYSQ